MNILFIHQNFPGQFRFISKALADRGHSVKALGIFGKPIEGVDVINYTIKKQNTPGIHPLTLEFETKVTRGEAAMYAMLDIKKSGFMPDLVIAHPGWGESLFAKDVFPDAKVINYIEFYYDINSDISFDPEFKPDDLTARIQVRAKNANNLINLDAMDAGISPTQWQKSTAPEVYQQKIKVIFDGVDTSILKPLMRPQLKIKLADQREVTLNHGDEIVTYVARNLEPYRGFHSFMRALPSLMKSRPSAKIIIIGDNKTSYGKAAPKNETWQSIFFEEVKDRIDLDRIYFLGPLAYEAYVALLQMSQVHVYLTYPFVMSWSAIEAMSCGALVLGSKTPPVEEFIQHNKNGLLVDFFDYEEIADTIAEALASPENYAHLKESARKTIVDGYDLKTICLPQQIEYFESFLAAKN